jgi:phage/plasmid-like protein (TIGR03299 family)
VREQAEGNRVIQISSETVVPTPEDIRQAVATQMATDAMEYSREGAGTLARNVVTGMVGKYGFPWWAGSWQPSMGESPFYPHGIPAADVRRRVFGWDVDERPLLDVAEEVTFDDGHSEPIAYDDVPGWKTLRRSDTNAVLHVVKTSHRVHGFAETLLDGFQQIVRDTLVISSAGTLKGGRVGWVQIETDALEHASGVVIRPHALFTTSHDQTYVTSCRENATNVRCDNSHRRALGEDIPVWSMRHTRNSELDDEQVEKARKALGLMIEREADAWSIELDLLTREPVSDYEWGQFLGDLVPLVDGKGDDLEGRSLTLARTKREQLTQLWKSDPRVAPWKGSAWGVVQAVNTWQTHLQTVRNAHRFERQMTNALDGDTGDALALAKLDVVKAGGIGELRRQAAARQRQVLTRA